MNRLPGLRLTVRALLIATSAANTTYTINSNFYCQPSPR